jgi:hypothetical protein
MKLAMVGLGLTSANRCAESVQSLAGRDAIGACSLAELAQKRERNLIRRAQWRIVDPALHLRPPPQPYPPGSWGPADDRLAASYARHQMKTIDPRRAP